MKKILIIGGGGREHAIIKSLVKSNNDLDIYCAPGNGGISELATLVPIKATQIDELVAFSLKERFDMVVVAPDDPLVLGLVDELEKVGVRAFGPRKNAAIIEGSKAFSKELMKKYQIPTAKYETFTSFDDAINYIKNENTYPTVIKADGLALGKGVIIAQNEDEAKTTLASMMVDKVFGNSGSTVVIEEFLTGPEISVLAFTDGKTVVPMVSAQDHKRAYDNDEGLNTGGMGTFSPSRVYTEEMAKECMQNIFIPTIEGLQKEGRTFKGVIYFGLMATKNGVKVIEYNARFGDPETQVVLPRLKSNLLHIFDAIIDERLDEIKIEWENNACVCVVMASGGYPQKYETDYEITGLKDIKGNNDIFVYHAGTKLENGKFLTAGGRVLGVTSIGYNLDDAISKAYKAVVKINFKDAHYRTDIGVK
jgi:phosphoribosylamine--glycine ligase